MNSRLKIMSKPHGFTLVELSIVLVIIGLIIGGVLTGQQVIQNARVTKTLNDLQGYESQFQTYQQNYGVLPGDDSTATTRFPTAGLAGNGNGNGSLDAKFTFDSTTLTDETVLVWQDLRAANLVKSQTPNNQPSNPFSGIYGFQTGAFGGVFTTTVICLNNVPGTAAQAIDTRLDDGAPNGGSVQAMVSTGAVGEATAGTVATSYVASSTYTMCIKM
jgi:prepilin-type N-terminal cleavage/methylation domain-containing protein